MWEALASGAAGAAALNVVHETARHHLPKAPHVQRIGERIVTRTARRMGRKPPRGSQRYGLALAGDITANALYYGLVGLGGRRGTWAKGALLGLAGGLGAVLLPPVLGLGARPVRRTPQTAAMTALWYTLGGLAAAAAYRALTGPRG